MAASMKVRMKKTPPGEQNEDAGNIKDSKDYKQLMRKLGAKEGTPPKANKKQIHPAQNKTPFPAAEGPSKGLPRGM